MTCSNPTLSYTQRLEGRIKELENQVAQLSEKTSPAASAIPQSSPPPSASQEGASQRSRRATDENGVSGSFKSLKIDDKGSITYHGATSFFNLPSDRNGSGFSDLAFLNPSSDADSQHRERLVSNAWHQRALENLSDIPVRLPPPSMFPRTRTEGANLYLLAN
ncbi:hypothetical protein AAL_01662 [Moelleriella libera RCEF 2490]|uniref:Uncharacterized protein n=1 Tax=Moelleriella libera RCEF 2490 TaxID=1081109 RepID=A0A166UC28_9HYPO|nr:hypothetical protein AAL_01662 [Moelleriella libera RCEF 2490]